MGGEWIVPRRHSEGGWLPAQRRGRRDDGTWWEEKDLRSDKAVGSDEAEYGYYL